MYKQVNLANSPFVGFTKPRLIKRLEILTGIIVDPDAMDYEIEDAARKRREVKECLALFIETGVEEEGVTVADLIKVLTGKEIEFYQKNTEGGRVAIDVVEKMNHAAKATSKATRKGLHGFFDWGRNITKPLD